MENITRLSQVVSGGCETGDQASKVFWGRFNWHKVIEGRDYIILYILYTLNNQGLFHCSFEIENPTSSIKTERQVSSKTEAKAQRTRKIVEVKQVVACPGCKRRHIGLQAEANWAGNQNQPLSPRQNATSTITKKNAGTTGCPTVPSAKSWGYFPETSTITSICQWHSSLATCLCKLLSTILLCKAWTFDTQRGSPQLLSEDSHSFRVCQEHIVPCKDAIHQDDSRWLRTDDCGDCAHD